MVAILFSLSVLLIGHFQAVFGEREHKVHNIVLYPEKHSWCQTTPIQQVVASPGYEAVTIQNNVCVGACFSYSIPKSEPAEPGELIGPYCDSCQPSQIQCYHVNLQADNSDAEAPKVLQKRVQIIMNCSCQSCDKVRTEDCAINDTNTSELPKHMFVDEEANKFNEEVIHPDLFDVQNSQNKHFENDTKLKDKLKKWFESYQNKAGDSIKTPEVDLEKNDNNKKNEKIRKDLEGLPKNFGMEGTPLTTHLKGSHIAMGIVHHPNDVVDSDIHKLGHHHHGHHHLGETQQIGTNLEHLIQGPHGSKVAAPLEVKLHIDSDSLKPNDEGLVVEYENHHHKGHKSVGVLEEK